MFAVVEKAHAAALLEVMVHRVERGPLSGAEQDQVPLAAVLKRADDETLLAQVGGHAENVPIHERLGDPGAPHDDADLSGLQVEHAGGGARWLAPGDLGGVLGELLRPITRRDFIKTAGLTLSATALACIADGFRAYRIGAADPGEPVFDARRMVEKSAEICHEVKAGLNDAGDWSIDFHTRFDLVQREGGWDLVHEQP